MVQQVTTILRVVLINLRNGVAVSLDEKYSLVPKVARPVCVDL